MTEFNSDEQKYLSEVKSDNEPSNFRQVKILLSSIDRNISKMKNNEIQEEQNEIPYSNSQNEDSPNIDNNRSTEQIKEKEKIKDELRSKEPTPMRPMKNEIPKKLNLVQLNFHDDSERLYLKHHSQGNRPRATQMTPKHNFSFDNQYRKPHSSQSKPHTPNANGPLLKTSIFIPSHQDLKIFNDNNQVAIEHIQDILHKNDSTTETKQANMDNMEQSKQDNNEMSPAQPVNNRFTMVGSVKNKIIKNRLNTSANVNTDFNQSKFSLTCYEHELDNKEKVNNPKSKTIQSQNASNSNSPIKCKSKQTKSTNNSRKSIGNKMSSSNNNPYLMKLKKYNYVVKDPSPLKTIISDNYQEYKNELNNKFKIFLNNCQTNTNQFYTPTFLQTQANPHYKNKQEKKYDNHNDKFGLNNSLEYTQYVDGNNIMNSMIKVKKLEEIRKSFKKDKQFYDSKPRKTIKLSQLKTNQI